MAEASAEEPKFLIFGKSGWIGGLVGEELERQVCELKQTNEPKPGSKGCQRAASTAASYDTRQCNRSLLFHLDSLLSLVRASL